MQGERCGWRSDTWVSIRPAGYSTSMGAAARPAWARPCGRRGGAAVRPAWGCCRAAGVGALPRVRRARARCGVGGARVPLAGASAIHADRVALEEGVSRSTIAGTGVQGRGSGDGGSRYAAAQLLDQHGGRGCSTSMRSRDLCSTRAGHSAAPRGPLAPASRERFREWTRSGGCLRRRPRDASSGGRRPFSRGREAGSAAGAGPGTRPLGQRSPVRVLSASGDPCASVREERRVAARAGGGRGQASRARRASFA